MNRKHCSAFTLLEFLCVAAIVAVLSAVGLLNYQEARARAQVGRVRSDMRQLALGIESYCVDRGGYPAAADGDYLLTQPLTAVTTPVAYLTSLPPDPFSPAELAFAPGIFMDGYQYKDRDSTSHGMPADTYGYIWRALPDKRYYLHSAGPNRIWDVSPYVDYDPTNGTVSGGDVARFGPH